ncbi:DUF4229 domain-containing protein [Streptomyces sp. Z26]|uniref:DUF4229 domain-containing protein n=1 Tax=Streptomyces sp. Z26 TaxID=2500177 RepID=UPI000EF16401|nr:DUF4229 domain-containing protein [Streptomyces sp. Z26]RLL68337.1 DUF4229 domain-containing protein [Streptomyces sp. Z26]
MSSSTSHATLRYTLMRLAIFAGCLVVAAVLAYVGVLPEGIGDSNPLWIFLLALLLSAPLSFVLLAKQRDAMARQLADGVDTAKGRLAANRSMEDEEAGAADASDAVDVGGAGDRDRDRTADEAPRTA